MRAAPHQGAPICRQTTNPIQATVLTNHQTVPQITTFQLAIDEDVLSIDEFCG